MSTKYLQIEYICPMCDQDHEDEIDMTFIDKDLESMTQAITEGFGNEDTARFLSSDMFVQAMTKVVTNRHLTKGDYPALARKYNAKPQKPPPVLTDIRLADERKPACKNCRRTFESTTLLQIHQGYDPITMKPNPDMKSACLGPVDRT